LVPSERPFGALSAEHVAHELQEGQAAFDELNALCAELPALENLVASFPPEFATHDRAVQAKFRVFQLRSLAEQRAPIAANIARLRSRLADELAAGLGAPRSD